MRSVKIKIILLVLCCTIVSSVAIGAASILNSRSVVSADSVKSMNLLCKNKAQEMDALLSRIEQSVETLTVFANGQLEDVERFKHDPAYVDEYTNSLLEAATNAAQNTEGAQTVYIRYNTEFTDPKSGFFYKRSSLHGNFKELEPTDLSLYEPTDTEHVGWFYEPLQKGEGTWTDPYYNENIQLQIITYAIPMYQNGEFIGIVGMDIDFKLLQKIIADTQVYDTGYAFLTDDRARIIQHQDVKSGTELAKYNRGEFKAMAEELQDGNPDENALISYPYLGTKKTAAFQVLSNGMRFVLAAPDKEIYEQADRLIFQISVAVLLIVAAAITFTFIFTKRLVKPLLELTSAAKKIADGDLSVTIEHKSDDEVGELAESFRQTVVYLHKYISYINELAYKDPLTGVSNKTAYMKQVDKMDELSRTKGQKYSIIVFDINELKTANDTHGHDFGDLLIMNACKIISRAFEGNQVYRIGGDEFAVLLEGDWEEMMGDVERKFKTSLEEYNNNPSGGTRISIAFGTASYCGEMDMTYNDVFRKADSAMYKSKMEHKQHEHEEKD